MVESIIERTLLVILLCPMYIIGLCNETNNIRYEDLEKEINQFIKQTGIVGLDVAVIKEDSLIFNKAYGYKNLKIGEKYKTDDLCWIGSISKTFVATGIMQLVDKGKIHLDDDAGKFLNFRLRNPKFPNTPISIRMLLCHKSSIIDNGPWYDFKFINPENNPDYSRYYLDFAPGDGYKYCNYNYNILAAIIENVSETRFDQYIYDNITKPLEIYGDYNCNNLDSSKFVTIYHDVQGKIVKSDVPYKPYKNYLFRKLQTQ